MKKNCVICDAEFELLRNKMTCSKGCSIQLTRQRNKLWRIRNAKELAKKKSQYQKKNRGMITERKKKWRETRRPPKIDIQCKECKEYFTPTTRAKHTTFCSNLCKVRWWAKEPKTNLCARIRNGIRDALKERGIRKGEKTFTLLGYSPDDLMFYLESQFTDGMSWDNMGKWHIDHKRPVSSFNYDSTEHPDFKKCWALNNLQPLWAEDNLRKNDKWDGVVNA